MISSVSGKVIACGSGYAVVDVSGVGLRLDLPQKLRAPIVNTGDEVFFHTAFIVREDAMTLYGFQTELELEVFNLLMTVSGVGPRSALGVLSELDPTMVAQAVANEDEKPFRAVSGIGPKTAKLITVSLAGKFKHIQFAGDTGALKTKSHDSSATVIAGLVALGWQESLAERAASAAEEEAPDANVEELLRVALKLLQKPDFAGRQR